MYLSHITSLLVFGWHWWKTTIQAAAILITVSCGYYTSYLSHIVKFINWIRIICSLQIIAVFLSEQNSVNTTTTTIAAILVGHVRLYTNVLSETWLAMFQYDVRPCAACSVLMVFVFFMTLLNYLYERRTWCFIFHMKRHVPVMRKAII
jgi:uncharacterized membrane protein